MPESKFFAGGVNPDSPFYIERRADRELLELCLAGQSISISSARQTGKTSLIRRAAKQLTHRGILSVVIDLTLFGSADISQEKWFFGFVHEVASRLHFELDVIAWWKSQSELPIVNRCINFFNQVLIEVKAPVVIFIDELDVTLSLPFRQNFYNALRAYIDRSDGSKSNRLSFVLSSMFSLYELSPDFAVSPLANVLHLIELADFTNEEALPLANGLGLHSDEAQQVLKWVLKWSGGHPYLTQRLCEVIVQQGQTAWSEYDVDRLVADTFLSDGGVRESNFNVISALLARRAEDPLEALRTYRDVRRGYPLVYDTATPAKRYLKSLGLVRSTDSILRVRNRIYEAVFDERWIEEQISSIQSGVHSADPRQGSSHRRTVRAPLKYSCFISYAHSQGILLRKFLDELYKALSSELSLLNELPIFLDQERLQLGYKYSEQLEQALSESACMIMIYTPRYFENDYCAREYKAMENLEKARLDLLGPSEKNSGLIIPIVLRGENRIPDVIKNERLLYDFTDITGKPDELIRNPKYSRMIRDIARYIDDRRYAFEMRPEAFITYEDFHLPTSEEISSWTDSLIGDFAQTIQSPERFPSVPIIEDEIFRRLSPSSRWALLRAEGLRESANTKLLWSEFLLAGLFMKSDGPARRLLTLFDDLANVVSKLEELINLMAVVKVAQIENIRPAPSNKLLRLPLSANALKVLLKAADLSNQTSPDKASPAIRSRHLLAGMLAVEDSVAGRWIADQVGMQQDTLYRLILNTPDLTPPLDIIRNLSSRGTYYQLLRGHSGEVTAVAFSPDGSIIATSGHDQTVRLWDTFTAKEIKQVTHRKGINALAFSPDGTQLVAFDVIGHLIAWWMSDLGSTIESSKAFESYGPITKISYRPDGKQIAASGDSGVVMFWDGVGLQESFRTNIGSRVAALRFTANSEKLIIASDGPEVIISASSQQTPGSIFHLPVDSASVKAIASEQYLVVGDEEGIVRLIDIETQEAAFLSDTLSGDAVTAISVTPDGRYAACGSAGGVVSVLDLEAKKSTHRCIGPSPSISAIAISPDGNSVVAASSDGMTCVWNVRKEPRVSSTAPSISRQEALVRIQLLKGDLFDLPVDATVNAVGTDSARSGTIGMQLNQRLGASLANSLVRKERLTLGETLVSDTQGRMPFHYVIHTCTELESNRHSLKSIREGVVSALRKAESLNDVRTLAFPSIGTGSAGMNAADLAPEILKAVVRHLEQESKLERIIFVFTEDSNYAAYSRAYQNMGGEILSKPWLSRLHQSAHDALSLAESLRRFLIAGRVDTKGLLWSFYALEGSDTRKMLDAVADDWQTSVALDELVEFKSDVRPSLIPNPLITLESIKLSSHCRHAFERAHLFASLDELISERHIIAGILTDQSCETTKWVADWLDLPAERIIDILLGRGDKQAEQESIGEQVRRAIGQVERPVEQQVPAHLYHLSFENTVARAEVGEVVTMTLRLTTEPEEGSELFRVPVSALELCLFVEAPNFQQESERQFAWSVINGTPIESVYPQPLKLIPLISGKQTISVRVYPGQVSGLAPTVLSHTILVEPSIILPRIPELNDPRLIPNPQPDVVLYVAHEETPNGQKLQMYLNCRALNIERRPLEPLALTAADLTSIRQAAMQSAARASDVAPSDALSSLRAFGSALFDLLMPSDHDFRSLYGDIFLKAGASERMWSWLIISDERAVLPWEMVCPYDYPEGSDNVFYDEFLSRKFMLSHWVGRQNLKLVSHAPLGHLDLLHYRQCDEDELAYWQAAFGGKEVVKVEAQSEKMALMQRGSPFYGLHILRYEGLGQKDLITTAQGDTQDRNEKLSEPIEFVQDKHLGFSLRRPLVGLSSVDKRPPNSINVFYFCDEDFDRDWALAFMHAGATALVGSRWPVQAESDQLFYRTFYREIYDLKPIGLAVWKAREEVFAAFPHRTDWLAYTHFGHPGCKPYIVQPSEGFVLFEALDHQEEMPFIAGQEYQFRASYRSEPPLWYDGRLQLTHPLELEGEGLSVIVKPMTESRPTVYPMKRVPASDDYHQIIPIKMPAEETTLPVMVRFQNGERELRTLMLNLDVVVRSEQ